MLSRHKRAFGVLVGLMILLWLCIGFGLLGSHPAVSFFHRLKTKVANHSASNAFRVEKSSVKNQTSPSESPMVVAVVCCGMRLHEALNMIKSAIVFHVTDRQLQFVVVTEDNLTTSFKEKLDDWRIVTKNAFTYKVLPLTFPEQNKKEWRNLFKPCAAQRLFLPTLLADIDSVLYVDSDTIFLSPVDHIWQLFSQFNASQIAALAPEHEDKNVGWYNRFARHPFYGPMGVNSGVMLMNLTRMREFKWDEYILPLYKEYKLKITFGDQDLINILFYYHPDKLFVFPCEWNFRPDHCMYMSVCKAPAGVKVLHGNRGYFHSEQQPVFSAIYRTIELYQLGTDRYLNMLLVLEQALIDSPVAMSKCGQNVDQFLVAAREVIKRVEYYSDYSTNLLGELTNF